MDHQCCCLLCWRMITRSWLDIPSRNCVLLSLVVFSEYDKTLHGGRSWWSQPRCRLSREQAPACLDRVQHTFSRVQNCLTLCSVGSPYSSLSFRISCPKHLVHYRTDKMPRAPRPGLVVPESYHSLGFRQITVSNVPKSSSSVTPVLLITLNRPQKLNAFTDIMREDLERVYELIDIDPRVKAVVLTGAGKSFCAGADLEIGFPGVQDANGVVRRPKMERDVDHRDG